MISITKNIKQLLLLGLCVGFVMKYQDLRHYTSKSSAAGTATRRQMENNQSGQTEDYQMQSNLSFLAKLTQKFPPQIRDYFKSERPFLREEGKNRFFEYLSKAYPDQKEKFKYEMRRMNETWHRRLPSAIIIGCKKCGTTFLKDVLIRHPFVAMAETENGHFIMREKYTQGWPFYRSEMALSLPDQITMEKSPLYWPVTGTPKRIYDYNPDVKLILVVRDPACRIASDFFFGQSVVGYVPANLTFEDAMTLEKERKTRDFLGFPSRYGPIMRTWLEHFPIKNFKIIRNEDMLTMKVKDVLADLEKFLGIPHGVNVVQRGGREICVEQPVEARNFCFNATRAEDMPCKYYRQYPSIMKDLHDEYIPFAKDFSELVKRDFEW